MTTLCSDCAERLAVDACWVPSHLPCSRLALLGCLSPSDILAMAPSALAAPAILRARGGAPAGDNPLRLSAIVLVEPSLWRAGLRRTMHHRRKTDRHWIGLRAVAQITNYAAGVVGGAMLQGLDLYADNAGGVTTFLAVLGGACHVKLGGALYGAPDSSMQLGLEMIARGAARETTRLPKDHPLLAVWFAAEDITGALRALAGRKPRSLDLYLLALSLDDLLIALANWTSVRGYPCQEWDTLRRLSQLLWTAEAVGVGPYVSDDHAGGWWHKLALLGGEHHGTV